MPPHTKEAGMTTAKINGVDIWSPWWLAYSCAWVVLGSIGAMLVFHRAQYLFAERI